MKKIANHRGQNKTRNSPKLSKYPRGGWLRLYRSILNDPKIQLLSPHLFRTWINLLCVASESGHPDGHLPDESDIAFKLRMSLTDVRSHVDDLIMVGLLDIAPSGHKHPHNWASWQPSDSRPSTQRVRRFRDKVRAVKQGETRFTSVSETPNETPETCSYSLSHSTSTLLPRGEVEPLPGKIGNLSKGTYTRGGGAA